jgi:hypothetical protein
VIFDISMFFFFWNQNCLMKLNLNFLFVWIRNVDNVRLKRDQIISTIFKQITQSNCRILLVSKSMFTSIDQSKKDQMLILILWKNHCEFPSSSSLSCHRKLNLILNNFPSITREANKVNEDYKKLWKISIFFHSYKPLKKYMMVTTVSISFIYIDAVNLITMSNRKFIDFQYQDSSYHNTEKP